MKACFFEKDVTPPVGTFLNGFGARDKPSEGVDDPIFVRVLGLEDDQGERAVFVTADILWFHRDMSFRIKARAEREYGVKSAAVVLNASHTHCGPVLAQNPVYPHWPVNPDYVLSFEESILEGIRAVFAGLQPARIKVGVMQSHFGINRRLRHPDGKVDNNILPNKDGYYDPDLPVIAVYDQDKPALRGLFYSYACHPSEKGGGNFSANFPGAIARALKKKYGSQIATLFAQGAGGDIKPRFIDEQGKRFVAASVAQVEELGQKIANEIIAHVASPAMREIKLAIHAAEREFEIPYDLKRMYRADEFLEWSYFHDQCRYGMPVMCRMWAHKMYEDIRTNSVKKADAMHVAMIALSKDVQIITLSGETVAEIGKALKAMFANKTTLFFGYCTYVGAYIPVARMLAEGGYESERCVAEYMMSAPFVPEIDAIIKDAVLSLESPR